jgi:hypothetical protein
MPKNLLKALIKNQFQPIDIMKIQKLLLSLSSAILIALSTAGASDYEEPYATTVSKTDAQITINLMHVRYGSQQISILAGCSHPPFPVRWRFWLFQKICSIHKKTIPRSSY